MTHKKHTTDSRPSIWLRYLSGKLSDNERYDLEQQLANDPKARLAVEAMAQNELSSTELEHDLSDIRQRWHNRSNTRTRQRPVWVSRVAAVLFLGFGVWAVTKYYNNQQGSVLYADFFESNDYMAVRGGNNASTEFSQALKAYEDKNYESSFMQFQHLNELQAKDNQIRLYAARSAMQLGKLFEAKQFLFDIIDETHQASEEASAYWYLALVYLQENKKKECKKRLQWLIDNAPDSQWGSNAKKLMRELK